jgi:hypothetical protein
MYGTLVSEHLGAGHPCQWWALVPQVFYPKPLQAKVFLGVLRRLWFRYLGSPGGLPSKGGRVDTPYALWGLTVTGS